MTANPFRQYLDLCGDSLNFMAANEFWFPPRSVNNPKAIGGLMRFDAPKIGQRRIRNLMETMLREEGRALVEVYKARQVGSSTESLARLVQRCMTRPFYKGAIASMNDDSTLELFLKLKILVENVNRFRAPNAVVPWPSIVKNNDNELRWDNGSSIKVATVGETGKTKHPFSSFTPWFLLGSECAKWQNPGPAWTSMINSCNIARNSGFIGVLESTSNGVEGPGEWWYKRYLDQKARATEWRMVFVSWMDDEENYEQPSSYEQDEFDLWLERYHAGEMSATKLAQHIGQVYFIFDEYEQNLAIEHGATCGQLKWFSELLRNKCSGSIEERRIQRAQENPSTPEESFTFSGDATFDPKRLNELFKQRTQPVYVAIDIKRLADAPLARVPEVATGFGGSIQLSQDATSEQVVVLDERDTPIYNDRDGGLWRPTVTPAADGKVRLFVPPRMEWKDDYYCGIDVSEGAKGVDSDATCACIMRYDRTIDTWHQEAVFECLGEDPDTACDELAPLLKLYYEPLVNVERPGPGEQLLRRLQNGHAYTRFYRRERWESATREVVREYGWRQTGPFRKMLIGKTQTRIFGRTLVLRDERTINQFGTMKRKWKNGNRFDEHPKGAHDDLVFATMLAIICTEEVTVERDRVLASGLSQVQGEPLTFKEMVLRRKQMDAIATGDVAPFQTFLQRGGR